MEELLIGLAFILLIALIGGLIPALLLFVAGKVFGDSLQDAVGVGFLIVAALVILVILYALGSIIKALFF